MMLLLNAVRCMTRWRLVTDGRAGGDERGGRVVTERFETFRHVCASQRVICVCSLCMAMVVRPSVRARLRARCTVGVCLSVWL